MTNLREMFSGLASLFKAEQTEAANHRAAEAGYKKLALRAGVLYVESKPLTTAESDKLFAAAKAIGRKAAQVEADLAAIIKAEKLRRAAAELPRLQEKMATIKAAKIKALPAVSPSLQIRRERAQDFQRVCARHQEAKQAVIRAKDTGSGDLASLEAEELKSRAERVSHNAETERLLKEAEARQKTQQTLSTEARTNLQKQINAAQAAVEQLREFEAVNSWLFDAPDVAALAAEQAAERNRLHLVRDTSPPMDQANATYPVMTFEGRLQASFIEPGLREREWILLPGQDESDMVLMADALLEHCPVSNIGPRRIQHLVYLRERDDRLAAPGPLARDMTLWIDDLEKPSAPTPDPSAYIVLPWLGQSVRAVEKLKAKWKAKHDGKSGAPFDQVSASRHAHLLAHR
jgi:hypothetical protein